MNILPYPDRESVLLYVDGIQLMALVQQPANYPDLLNVTLGSLGEQVITVYLDDWKAFMALINDVDALIQSRTEIGVVPE